MAPTNTNLLGRLRVLKRRGVIAGFESPHANRGLGGGMLPWVVMHIDGGPSTICHTEGALTEAVTKLERFGPRHGLSPADFMARN